MKIFKPKFWQKKNSFLPYIFLPLSIFFQILIFLKKILVKKEKFSIPVICVGNIYLGGTGKTPLCIELVEILRKLNRKTAIIKKFYKNHEDEFRLIEAKKIKLFKETSRAVAVKKAKLEKFDCVVLDDGFQDSTIVKDLSIVCFNGEQLAGNGMTLPSGPLREKLSSIKNSQIVVINGKSNETFEEQIKSISNNIDIYYSDYLPTNLNQFTDQNLLAFAGIGNPDNFFKFLEVNNLRVAKKISFPDHYNYSIKELNDLVNYSKNNRLKIITTEKDYFRIKHYKISDIQCLNVELGIRDKDKFIREIEKYI
jgi:tetraacyldisaccharide 4'-kinase|tara:strand:- start:355 stop:1284 length:930 start_codon:yes stop_codon:yes gene_type:complete